VFGPERELVLAKELTKTFEHLEYGTAAQITAWLEADPQRCQGEMVLMIAPTPKAESELSDAELSTLKLLLTELPLKKAAALTAQIHGGKKNALYKVALQLSGETG
jgi:16S rRNA (cytidine1402-2'-O)-methyltransferase